MKKFIVSALTAAVMISSFTVSAFASTEFSDLPSTHWAYEDVTKVANEGIIKGTGNGKFSPNTTLSANQFLVMVGRTCYDTDIEATPEDNWCSAYVREAEEKGILNGTDISDATIKDGITRYDMSVILTNVGRNIIKTESELASPEKVEDYSSIPSNYTDAVLWSYGSGLLQGDAQGNFNGEDTMTRAQAATVISRLMALQVAVNTEQPNENDAEEEQPPVSEEDEATMPMRIYGYAVDAWNWETPNKPIETPFELSLYYMVDGKKYDGIKLASTMTDTTGYFEFDIEVPEKYFSYSYADCYYIAGEVTENGVFLTTAPSKKNPGYQTQTFSYVSNLGSKGNEQTVLMLQPFN